MGKAGNEDARARPDSAGINSVDVVFHEAVEDAVIELVNYRKKPDRGVAAHAGDCSRPAGTRAGMARIMQRRVRRRRIEPLGPEKGLVALVEGTPLLVVASPVISAAAIAIRLADGPPVLFLHFRTRRNEVVSTMHRFRTMRAPRTGADMFRTDEQRVTWIGSFVRKTGLDELPELVNVLKGEMSLVSPRRLLVDCLTNYSARYRGPAIWCVQRLLAEPR